MLHHQGIVKSEAKSGVEQRSGWPHVTVTVAKSFTKTLSRVQVSCY